MKTASTALGAIALALIGAPANAQEADAPLRIFLLECDNNLDGCRAYLSDAIMLDISVGMRLSNKPEPACVPPDRNKAADMTLAYMHELARDPAWAEGLYEDALVQAMDDVFPCLMDYYR